MVEISDIDARWLVRWIFGVFERDSIASQCEIG